MVEMAVSIEVKESFRKGKEMFLFLYYYSLNERYLCCKL